MDGESSNHYRKFVYSSIEHSPPNDEGELAMMMEPLQPPPRI
jgi:hypothetical protein